MLIRLIPSASQPTVLFKLVFENLPDTIQTPVAWDNLLAALDSDDLDFPKLMHALDKAVGVQSILNEVTFNLIEEKIQCIFVDREMDGWEIGYDDHTPIREERKADLVRRLDSVIEDVIESAAEIDRERKREEEKEQKRVQEEQQQDYAKQGEFTAPNSSDRKNKAGHKKKRSLLMNLASSILSLSLNSPRIPGSPHSSSPSSPSSRSTSPASSIRSSRSETVAQTASAPSTLFRSVTLPATKNQNPRPLSLSSISCPVIPIGSPPSLPAVIVGPPLPPPLSPRALRRRARSTLVDAFRLYVLPELTRRVRCCRIAGSVVNTPVALYGSDTFAPYYSWAIMSTLKRVVLRLSEVGRELREEMDAFGIELSTFPLGSLTATGLASLPNLSEYGSMSAQGLHWPLSGSSTSLSDGDIRSVSEAGGDVTGSSEADSGSISDATLVDSISESVHYYPPKPSLAILHEYSAKSTAVSSLATSPTTSPCSEIFMPSPIVPPEVPLPESLKELLVQYNELSSSHLRLAHLLLATHARAAAVAADVMQREIVLEVRSRRRAWLSRALNVSSVESPKVNSTTWSETMSSPFRPSGLGKYSYSSEEWDCDPYHYLDAPCSASLSPSSSLITDVYPNPFDPEGEGSYASHVYAHRRKRSASETSIGLFTVCEEETVFGFDTGASIYHNDSHAHYNHLDVEIDTDEDEDEEDSQDLDMDPLVDINVELDGPTEQDDVLDKPSRPFLQIDTFSGTIVPQSSPAPLKKRLEAKVVQGTSDPFGDPEDNFRASLALVVAANVSKRIKGGTKTNSMSDVVS